MFLNLNKAGLGVALVLGIALGAALTGFWPSVPMYAVATDRNDSFAVATGYCDESVEAVYFLDFLTGDLTAAVVAKQNGKFNAFYTHNVIADLGIAPGKTPRFLITTGMADLRHSGGKVAAPSRSLIYVSELTTGKVAAYAIPWSSSAWTAGQRGSGEIVLLDVGRFRSAGGGGAVGKETER